MTNERTEEAKGLFIHYFRMVFEKAGVKWDPDFSTEIGVAVDCLIEAAGELAMEKMLRKLKSQEAEQSDISLLSPKGG